MEHYCIVWRSGGTKNFTWHRSLAMSRQAAEGAFKDTKRAGFHCHIEKFDWSVALGLPETFDYRR